MKRMPFNKNDIQNFESSYDVSHENKALALRGQFISKYPANQLKKLNIRKYVIGRGTDSFCSFVEAKTHSWAYIAGATSAKFGIYYGRTNSDPVKRYRYTKKFGIYTDPHKAFRAVKTELLSLVNSARHMDFQSLDENLLSQLFKAKILSLYYPDKYLNICSDEHLQMFAEIFGLQDGLYISEYQNLLLVEKQKSVITRDWSNPKYVRFLYTKFLPEHIRDRGKTRGNKKRKKHPFVDFNEMMKNQSRIGGISEKYAWNWEKTRLRGRGHGNLIKEMKNRTKQPSYGYDFLSHDPPNLERYIEVKSAKKISNNGYRIFLTENEYNVSLVTSNKSKYYFYLVLFNADGKPYEVVAKLAKDIYVDCEKNPCAYKLYFEL